MDNKIENIEKVFIVSRRKSKRVKAEEDIHGLTGAKIVLCFPNRKNAGKYIKYWTRGEDLFDVFERKLR